MNVLDPTISERYAHALLAAAKRQNAVAQVMQDAELLIPRSKLDERLHLFLEAPQIPTEAKSNLIRKAMENHVHPLTHNLMQLLLQRGRIEYTRPIIRRFVVLAEREQGILEAQVATAVQLDDSERQELQQSLERFTKARLKIQYVTEPTLIGGVRFSYGEMLVDDSVSGKLYRLRQELEQAVKAHGE